MPRGSKGFDYYKELPGWEVVDCSNPECDNEVVGRRTMWDKALGRSLCVKCESPLVRKQPETQDA